MAYTYCVGAGYGFKMTQMFDSIGESWISAHGRVSSNLASHKLRV